MTQKDRQAYAAHNIRQMKRIEGKYVRPIYQALRKTVTDFLEDARKNGIPMATNSLYLVTSNPALSEILSQLHVDAGLFFGRKAYREIQASVRVREKAAFPFTSQWIQDVINFFLQDMLSLVSNITNTTRNAILEVLVQGTAEGWSFEQMENALLGTIKPARARLIARTETAKGAFVGRQLANRDSEWVSEKEWIAAHDNRTRHGHRLVDGEVIDWEARFQVRHPKGLDMMYGPGDPSASAANLCNCRCAMATRAKRDANGRLIRKQTQVTTQI